MSNIVKQFTCFIGFDFHRTHILYGWIIILVWATLFTDIPASNTHIARFRWFPVKRPIYDASNSDKTIGIHHVNTTILTVVWISQRDLLVKAGKIIIQPYNMLVLLKNRTFGNMWIRFTLMRNRFWPLLDYAINYATVTINIQMTFIISIHDWLM